MVRIRRSWHEVDSRGGARLLRPDHLLVRRVVTRLIAHDGDGALSVVCRLVKQRGGRRRDRTGIA